MYNWSALQECCLQRRHVEADVLAAYREAQRPSMYLTSSRRGWLSLPLPVVACTAKSKFWRWGVSTPAGAPPSVPPVVLLVLSLQIPLLPWMQLCPWPALPWTSKPAGTRMQSALYERAGSATAHTRSAGAAGHVAIVAPFGEA